ncbi:hypothetical protein ACIOFV_21680 [Streptomyces mirabilis]|uniref:hypothetical protein n=1 Tax=Streptomyces mirabilis TaxID=68239 RepID=UPI003804D33A
MGGRRATYTVAAATTAALLLGVSGTAASAAAGSSPAATPRAAVHAFGQSDFSPEEAHLREVAASIWNADLAASWNMNPDVADVLSQATGEILRCSEAFALVPRPPGFLPGIGSRASCVVLQASAWG